MNKNAFGRPSVLQLTTRFDGRKTIVDDVYCTSPFKILPPVYLPDKTAQVIIMAASAGILAGDTQRLELCAGRHSRLELTSQAYEKIHPMPEGQAVRTGRIVVEPDAFLRYSLLPVIPFAGSAFASTLTFHLQDKSSRLIFVDIMACGRAARQERFQYRSYRSLVEIYTGDVLVFRDNTCFEPENMDMEGLGMFEGFSHLANIVICNFAMQAEQLQTIRAILAGDAEIQYGLSVLDRSDIVIKILGGSGQQLVDLYRKVCTVIL